MRNPLVGTGASFNGTNLNLVGANRNALNQGRCVNGLNGSIFGQVAFCNGTASSRRSTGPRPRGP